MKKFLHRSWFIIIAVIYIAWHAIPRGREVAEPEIPAAAIQPAPEPSPRPSPAATPKPLRRKKAMGPKALAAAAAPTPAPEPLIAEATPLPVPTMVPSPVPTPAPRQSPQPRSDQGVLEGVAFKNEEEVLANLGEPDEKLEHDDRVSWYYSKPARNRNGKPVCPELQFIDEEVRMVLMWPPEKMREKIATAKRLKAEGAPAAKSPTFTFVDSFKYLGVGTPDYTVLEDLGAPDSKQMVEGKDEWNYDTLIVENGASRRLTVVMLKGKVVEVRGR